MGTITAICLSEKKGTQKTFIESGELIASHGLKGDAHAGNWHRQISLLAAETIADFNAKGADVHDGAFGENLIVSGIDFKNLEVGSKLQSGDTLLEITQLGKVCHTRCHIYYKMGDCIMPKSGIFAKVLQGGTIKTGDPIHEV